MCALLVGGIYLLDLGSVGAEDGDAIGLASGSSEADPVQVPANRTLLARHGQIWELVPVVTDAVIAAGTPVVEICRVALDADGTPVEVNEMTADSSAYVFKYEFGA